MIPEELIAKYYQPKTKSYEVLIKHSELVTNKAIMIAEGSSDMNPDLQFIKEAAMLHDIGLFRVDDPDTFNYGSEPYICHGILGREILENEGLAEHALVCEKHIGVGLTVDRIRKLNLPLPHRNMYPETVEEKIICFADCFYSKRPEEMSKEKTPDDIRANLEKYWPGDVKIFNLWLEFFGA